MDAKRLEKARQLLAQGSISPNGQPHVYNVRSQAGNGKYTLRTRRHPAGRGCSCPDRVIPCKHILAAEMYEAANHARAMLADLRKSAGGHGLMGQSLHNALDHIRGDAEMTRGQVEGLRNLAEYYPRFSAPLIIIAVLLEDTVPQTYKSAMADLYDDERDTALPWAGARERNLRGEGSINEYK